MIRREHSLPPRHIYPAEPWRLLETKFQARFLPQTETFFSTSNGYVGMRGTFDEGRPYHQPGTFVNGFYESRPIVYGEEAFGFSRTGQTMLNVTDASLIRLYVDDEPFYLATADITHYERALDMRTGTLDRDVTWKTPGGLQVRIRSRRLVSFVHRHLIAILYELVVENATAPIVISSEAIYRHEDGGDSADPRRGQGFPARPLLPAASRGAGRRILLGHVTRTSGMSLACGVDHLVETDCTVRETLTCSEDEARLVLTIEARPDAPIRLTKFITYHTSRASIVDELCQRAERTLDVALEKRFPTLLEEQRTYLADFWHRSDVEIVREQDGERGGRRLRDQADLDQAIRFNLFHVLQASARAEGVGVPAKGLTGSGYEGHYFWDTEIYVLPFLIYTSPRAARNLLRFRFSFLEQARRRAREVNQRGALFAWRTINGEDASAYYAAGTAQYHINADIAYALRKYVEATGDEELLWSEGAEVLVETARLWRDLGFFSDAREGQFCIVGVTGPDEYNTVVNNNAFTNMMARENLRYAAAAARRLRDEDPGRYHDLVHRTGLEERELEEWQRAADRMFLPYDDARGIHLQDDAFLEKKPWNFEGTPSTNYPLLLHYHPLVIYRHQVIKQADVTLAMLLLSDEFSDGQKKRNFDFYDPLTTGDSSLSVCVQSVIASELGYTDLAIEYAYYASVMDMADLGGNVKDGCHIASMAGTWMAIVYGFAGFRDRGRFSFWPRPPAGLARLRFPLLLRGRRVVVDIQQEQVTYHLEEGDALSLWHGSEELVLSPDAPVAVRPLPVSS